MPADASEPESTPHNPWSLTSHQVRQLSSQLKACGDPCETMAVDSERLFVMEVFSPPRLATAAENVGLHGKSYDLKTGFDFTKSDDRRRVESDLVTLKPDLLMLCPPCTDEGGWFHLNSSRLDRLEYLRRVNRSRMFIRWCCKLFRMQTAAGRDAVFEHPTGAKTWSYPEMLTLCRKFHTVKLHMSCAGIIFICRPAAT